MTLPVFSCAIVRSESDAFPGFSQANVVSLMWFFINYLLNQQLQLNARDLQV